MGVIPDDWALKPLAELFTFSGGYTASRAQLSDAGHCYLHYGDIHAATKTTVDTEADLQDIPRLNVPLGDVAPSALLEDGDVVFVDASEDDEGASKHVVVENRRNVPFISGLHTIVAKGLTDELSREYRRYCFQTRAIRQQFLYYATGTKVKGISKTNIRKLWLPVPSLPEQRAIAAALSDVDALLGGLDRLIAKKRDLKQAAMQQLLTGQTRLPGFSGDWEAKRLGDLAEIVSGGTPRTDEPAYWNGGIKWCTPTDITRYSGKYLTDTERSISYAGLNNSGAVLLPVGALLLCSRATIGELKIAGAPICTNQGFKSLVCRPQVSNEFLYYKLLTMKDRMLERAFGSTFLEISTRNVSALEVVAPSHDEQGAIAAVLSDMDAELAALEARRDKNCDLKQAMMQELLTGKSRLVEVGRKREVTC